MKHTLLILDAGIEGVSPAMQVMEAVFDPAWGEAWSEKQLSNFLMGDCRNLLLAVPADNRGSPGSPAEGFALIRTVAGEAELMLLSVLPASRRSGIACALLEAASAVAAAHGAETIFLEVRANNEGARALYQRAGFAAIGMRPGYYRGADGLAYDAITYSKPLS